MAITITQDCEMCGRKRNLGGQNEEDGGWRLLDSGARKVTLCNQCIALVVCHAQNRAIARRDSRPGLLNDNPLTLQFQEVRTDGS